MKRDHKHSLMPYPNWKASGHAALTVMLILPSMVNVMSHEEDHCFQCQEWGHIAYHCPSVRCFKWEEYGHIVMGCPHRIPPLGTPANHHWPISHSSCHARSCLWHHHEDRDKWSCSRSQPHFYRQQSTNHHDSYRGHSKSHIGITDNITGVVLDVHTPIINLTMTHHIADHLCKEALLLTPEIAVNHAPNPTTNPQRKICTDSPCIPANHEGKHISKKIQEWK